MSWNPLRIVTRQASKSEHHGQLSELDKHVLKLEKLETSTKKLMKDVKKYEECLIQVNDREKGITTDLSNSMLCKEEEQLRSLVEQWHSNVSAGKVDDDLAVATEKTVLDPLKKFQGIFSEVRTSLKKRANTLKELEQTQQKVNKLQEKEKTGTNVVNLKKETKNLAMLKEEFKKQDELLQSELPLMYDGRIEYFQPCLEAFVKARVEHSGETVQLFRDTIPTLDRFSSETGFQEIQNQRLANIKALSIVAE